MVGALLVTTAAVATYVVARDGEEAPATRYVVASRDLAPGEVIDPADLGLVALELPAEVAASAYTDPAEVLAAVTRGPIAGGGLLTAVAVAVAADATAAGGWDAAGSATTGGDRADRYREVSFAVAPARALLGALVPGDRVDVVATLDERTEVLVQHALVLGADRGGDDALVVSDEVVITLALPDAAEALAVAHGAAVGELTVLRSTRADDDLPVADGAGATGIAPGPAAASGTAEDAA